MSLSMKSTGKVKFFDAVKGYGFIQADDGSMDVFVHQTNVKAKGFRTLAQGESVEYDVAEDPKRPGKLYAVDVTGPGGADVIGTSAFAPAKGPY